MQMYGLQAEYLFKLEGSASQNAYTSLRHFANTFRHYFYCPTERSIEYQAIKPLMIIISKLSFEKISVDNRVLQQLTAVNAYISKNENTRLTSMSKELYEKFVHLLESYKDLKTKSDSNVNVKTAAEAGTGSTATGSAAAGSTAGAILELSSAGAAVTIQSNAAANSIVSSSQADQSFDHKSSTYTL